MLAPDMPISFRGSACLSFILVASCLAMSVAAAEDELIKAAPKWYCSGRDLDRKVVWNSEAPGHFAGSLSIGDGRILVGASDWKTCTMTALDLSGHLLWQAKHPSLNSRVHDYGQPIHSEACFDDGRVYYVSNRGELMCVALEGFRAGKSGEPDTNEAAHGATDVKVIWRIDMMKELGVFKRDWSDVGNPLCSPIIIGDLVFCVTGHGVPSSPFGTKHADPDPPSFLAVHKLTGKVAWSSNAPNNGILFSQWASPVQACVNGAHQVIFPGGDGLLYGFEPATGRLLWKLDCNRPDAIDPFREERPWEREAESRCGFLGSPIVHGTTLYVALNQSWETPRRHPLLAIDLATPDGQPKVRWQFAGPGWKGTPVSAAAGNGLIFVTSDDCILFALDEITGRECWRAELDESARNIYSAPVVHEGRVYAGAETSVTVFEATREKKCVGQYEFNMFYIGTPHFAEGQMFVADEQVIHAVRLP
jgi:outer membrane protein assembly factor BamB